MSALCSHTLDCGRLDTTELGENMMDVLENIVRGCQMVAKCNDRVLLVSYIPLVFNQFVL